MFPHRTKSEGNLASFLFLNTWGLYPVYIKKQIYHPVNGPPLWQKAVKVIFNKNFKLQYLAEKNGLLPVNLTGDINS